MWGLSEDVSTQFYLFYDWGEVWQNQSTDFATMVNSFGGGVRIQPTRYTEVGRRGNVRQHGGCDQRVGQPDR
jgi:hemolysin activation/secretion protein